MEAGARGKTYKIGQAAKLLDVKPFVLRFWESEFKDVLVPVRTPSGQRAYTEGNVELVREIKRLLYDEGLTIEGAKKRLHQGKGQQFGQRSAQPIAQPGAQSTTQPGAQSGSQTPPQVPAAPQAASAPPQHFESQPALPGLARPEQIAAAQAAAAQLAAAQEAAAQARATAAAQVAAAQQAADNAAARADALALVLSDLQQELKAIRDLLG